MTTISMVTVFPKAAIQAALEAALLSEAKRKLNHAGATVPKNVSTLKTQPVVLDSLGVVEILMVVEPLTNCELPETLVRAGGYSSVAEAINHVMPGIERVWGKKNK